jgi:hypothetical protein
MQKFSLLKSFKIGHRRIDFCLVWSELLTWSWKTKTFDILSEIIIEYKI